MASTHAQSTADPLAFLQLTGHPIRWRLLAELARGDRLVQELADALGEPQNLVSYHLAKLRDGGLVRTHKSAADKRDAYYTANLDRIGSGLAEAGGNLHPALRLSSPDLSEPTLSHGRILFLCTGNSARSPLAAALMNKRSAGHVKAESAGSDPKPIHANAVRAMKELHGIDLSGHVPRHFSHFAKQGFDCVVTLCDRVREVCPEFPGDGDAVHWSIVNPVTQEPDAKTYPRFRDTVAELDNRICWLLAGLAAKPGEARIRRRTP